jgi:hypothetical protein
MGTMRIDYSKIPHWALESLNAYAQKGRPPGGFLTSCLANDLTNAFGRADEDSTAALRHIVAYIYNCVPSGCHGSYQRVEEWIEGGGADGILGPGAWSPGD